MAQTTIFQLFQTFLFYFFRVFVFSAFCIAFALLYVFSGLLDINFNGPIPSVSDQILGGWGVEMMCFQISDFT